MTAPYLSSDFFLAKYDKAVPVYISSGFQTVQHEQSRMTPQCTPKDRLGFNKKLLAKDIPSTSSSLSCQVFTNKVQYSFLAVFLNTRHELQGFHSYMHLQVSVPIAVATAL